MSAPGGRWCAAVPRLRARDTGHRAQLQWSRGMVETKCQRPGTTLLNNNCFHQGADFSHPPVSEMSDIDIVLG